MEVVAEADTAAEALRAVAQSAVDVIVLDLTLRGGRSLEAISRVLEHQPPPHVLVLTMHDDPAYARSALAAGAAGYVVKTISERDLLNAVRSVHHGQVVIDLDDERKTASVFGPFGSEPKTSATTIGKLSERELVVLRLLGQGHTNQAIAQQLDISPKTVATYRARIAEKLGLKSTADYVRYSADTGLLESSGQLR
jgi:DNA-binding NarL/FixJ family response regulator